MEQRKWLLPAICCGTIVGTFALRLLLQVWDRQLRERRLKEPLSVPSGVEWRNLTVEGSPDVPEVLCVVTLHPDTMRELKIAPGDAVFVKANRGSGTVCLAFARDSVDPETVWMGPTVRSNVGVKDGSKSNQQATVCLCTDIRAGTKVCFRPVDSKRKPSVAVADLLRPLFTPAASTVDGKRVEDDGRTAVDDTEKADEKDEKDDDRDKEDTEKKEEAKEANGGREDEEKLEESDSEEKAVENETDGKPPESAGAIFAKALPVRKGDQFTVMVDAEELVLEVLSVEIMGSRVDYCLITEETQLICFVNGKEQSGSDLGFQNLGGLSKQIRELRELVELPLAHPSLYSKMGITAPKGILLYGPHGTGKTSLAKAMVKQAGANLVMLHGPEIMHPHVGQAEALLRKVFDNAARSSPSVIIIDEIDSIAGKKETTGTPSAAVDKRVVSQLLTLMDGIPPHVLVIGTTNSPDAIDPGLRRAGRFEAEIEIPAPNVEGRTEILRVHTRNMPLHSSVDIHEIAQDAHGFVGADLAGLCRRAALACISDKVDALGGFPALPRNKRDMSLALLGMKVEMKHFNRAFAMVGPSSLRETAFETPDVAWEDIGGLEEVVRDLQEMVQYPLTHPQLFEQLGIPASKGLLLYGPPGCGKTLLAKAVATASKANFIQVKGPELMAPLLGESEANVRQLFARARAAAPCVLFFDELDSVAAVRGGAMDQFKTTDRIINQLLTEMDGFDKHKTIFVIGATNRPDCIDPAILRPGRLDQLVYVPLPDGKSRRSILKASVRKSPLAEGVDLDAIADKAEGFSGADLAGITQKAARLAIRERIKHELVEGADLEEAVVICAKHFDQVIEDSERSVMEDDIRRYEQFKSAHSNKKTAHLMLGLYM